MNKQIDDIVHHATVSEKAIEAYLAKLVKEMDGVCLKYSNPGMVGYPDRVVLLPCGITVWVELKSKGRKTTKAQALRIEHLRKLGHNVAVVDSKEAVDTILDGCDFLISLEGEE